MKKKKQLNFYEILYEKQYVNNNYLYENFSLNTNALSFILDDFKFESKMIITSMLALELLRDYIGERRKIYYWNLFENKKKQKPQNILFKKQLSFLLNPISHH